MVRKAKKATEAPVLSDTPCGAHTEPYCSADDILKENVRRTDAIHTKFNPVTGEGSIGERVRVEITDHPLPVQYLPKAMMNEPLVQKIIKAGSIKKFYSEHLADICPYSQAEKEKIISQLIRIRCKHDFAFWAVLYIYVLSKNPGEGEIHFRLNRAQRKLVEKLEKMRLSGKPIRLVLLKTRQWGGSTCIQLYMAWLQLVHQQGLNSIIVSQRKKTSFAIKAMYDRALEAYPAEMLHELGEAYNANEKKMVNVGLTGDYKKIPQRDCTITIASYEAPDAIRGDAYALAHISEVGLWEATEKKTPEKIVRSTIQGISYKPYTMIVYESTANGAGNFFHREYVDAKKGESQFEALFVPWIDVDWDTLPFDSEEQKRAFAEQLYANRNNETANSTREEPGSYLWWLWTKGATLEDINWYIVERSKCRCHADMASECPTDDIEAFSFSGRKVFYDEDIEQFTDACRPPRMIGEIYGDADKEEKAIQNLRFVKDNDGSLFVWHDVEKDTEEEEITDRYLCVVDVAKGVSAKADFADILVIDRLPMVDGEPPVVAAEWHGHIEMDRLAWKALQVAAYYNNALLVIESNTLETNNTKGEAEYILTLIADVYGKQLYARKQSAEDIRQKIPKKYGFHTNPLTKKVVIYNLQEVIRQHLYVEREEECLNEYRTYIETEKGGYEAMEGHHDDRLMTRAIGMQICLHEMELPRIVKRTKRKNTTNSTVISAATI